MVIRFIENFNFHTNVKAHRMPYNSLLCESALAVYELFFPALKSIVFVEIASFSLRVTFFKRLFQGRLIISNDYAF
jgi:hypothetical protein